MAKKPNYNPLWGYNYYEETNFDPIEDVQEADVSHLFGDAEYDKTTQDIVFYNLHGVELDRVSLEEIISSEIISEAYYDSETKSLILKFTNGTEVSIDLNDLIDIDEAGGGLMIDGDGHIAIKIADGSDRFLTVTDDGLALMGVDETFQEIFGGLKSGLGLVTENENESAFGKYNESNSGTVFSVGVGEDADNRANAVEVRSDGTVWMLIEGEMMNVNDLLSQIAHETYN